MELFPEQPKPEVRFASLSLEERLQCIDTLIDARRVSPEEASRYRQELHVEMELFPLTDPRNQLQFSHLIETMIMLDYCIDHPPKPRPIEFDL